MTNIQWVHAGVTEDRSTKAKINGRTYLVTETGSRWATMVWSKTNEEWKPLKHGFRLENDARQSCVEHAENSC